jgi:hypothetical protein
VAICLPGAKSGRSTTSTWDDADGDDKDIGDALSANIDADLDLIVLCAA